MPVARPELTLFELRRYRARPGRRDALIAMFEARFRPAYEAVGATILGSFTVAGEPDAWVWIRAFADVPSRAVALRGFYGSVVWTRLGPACNALLAEVSSAHVLRAVAAGDLALPPSRRVLQTLVPAPRPWVLSVQPRRAVTAAPAAPPQPLVLASARSGVLLRRFDRDPEAQAWLRAQPAGPGRSPHALLHPTACSRLR